ncbi:ATP-binding protein [Aestuariibius sp. HNIBRBA575]|uniref:ATP-binding protein n=1 Tax=Aestuariibius sp. HNIBRBA575 TaxID=3233343 RepID=UPI0034A4F614
MFFTWLKHYMPRSLYGRAALILILPVVTLQLVVSVTFIQRHFEGVTRQMSQSILIELSYLAEGVAQADSFEAAQQVVLERASPLEMNVVLPAGDVPAQDIRAFYDLSGREVIRTLRPQLLGMGPVDLSDTRRVKLWLETPHGIMQISFDRQRVSASNPHQLIVLMVVLGVLMTLIAYVYLRNQLRPIKRMAAAAAEYGKGRIVPYAPSGATEVRAAGNAFLDMRNRIERQVAARTLMLSGVSHDLRTPLTRLRLELSLMDEQDAAPLLRDVDDMQRLVDAFLDFARDEALDALEETDPVALIKQVVADAARTGDDVELGPISGVLPAPGTMPLRPMAICRALENLIGNALRYGGRAIVSISVSNRALKISVEDNGPGIPPQQRDEALKPFTRLDPSRNQNRGSGVGLGLAIVADITRVHGGAIRLADSDLMGGLRVDLIFPR